MERNGLVGRVEFEEMPPHVEYELTENAKGLVDGLQVLYEWGNGQVEAHGGCKGHPGDKAN